MSTCSSHLLNGSISFSGTIGQNTTPYGKYDQTRLRVYCVPLSKRQRLVARIGTRLDGNARYVLLSA